MYRDIVHVHEAYLCMNFNGVELHLNLKNMQAA